MLGPSRLSSLKTIGSSSRRKKKSSPYGPYLPGMFHCLEVVRRRTLSQASRKSQRTSSHNGSIRIRHLPIACHCCLASTKALSHFSTDLPHTSGLCPGPQVLFPQLQSRKISSQNVIFPSWIVKLFPSVLGCFDGPQGSCLLSLLRFFLTPTALLIILLESYISSQSLPSMPLHNAGRKYTSQHQPGKPHLSGLMCLTSMYAFEVFTSSALKMSTHPDSS